MSARPYRTEINGVTRYGIEFDSEAERDAVLRGRSVALDVSPSPARIGENDLDVVGGIAPLREKLASGALMRSHRASRPRQNQDRNFPVLKRRRGVAVGRRNRASSAKP
jgi:hypothetical protein